MALEVCVNLKRRYGFSPQRLIAAAVPDPVSMNETLAPFRPIKHTSLRRLQEFIVRMILPLVSSNHAHFYRERDTSRIAKRIVLDVKTLFSYKGPRGHLLDVPITVIKANQDAIIGPVNVRRWGKHTTCDVTVMFFDGGHFFIMEPARIPALMEYLGGLCMKD